MKRKTAAELLDIVECTTDEWHPDAIKAARVELLARDRDEVYAEVAEPPVLPNARDARGLMPRMFLLLVIAGAVFQVLSHRFGCQEAQGQGKPGTVERR
ncbi:MAG: hypothetical protein HOO96_14965 [Polyangiaceae bacterium]|nr:hypothetical protein [Polyangiaceae bacterium]